MTKQQIKDLIIKAIAEAPNTYITVNEEREAHYEVCYDKENETILSCAHYKLDDALEYRIQLGNRLKAEAVLDRLTSEGLLFKYPEE
jgi:hypothetical protein